MRETVVRSPAGVDLAVAEHGGDGPPLVLVHGLGSNLRIWDAVASELTDRFRVVAYDQRGHGRSTDPPDADYGYEALVADLEAVLDSHELDAPYLVGHSWGASTALAYAIMRDGCPGVVCVDGGVIDLQDIGVDWDIARQILRPEDPVGPADQLLERFRAEQAVLPWDRLEPVVRRSYVTDGDGTMRRRTRVEHHMLIVRHMWEARVAQAYERVKAPVMCVLAHGYVTDERVAAAVAAKQECARRLSERHPQVRIEWLESTHDIPLLHPSELAGLVAEFFSPPE